MNLTEVATLKQARDFIDLPKRLYENDPHWICPLDSDVEAIFDPSRNVFFRTVF